MATPLKKPPTVRQQQKKRRAQPTMHMKPRFYPRTFPMHPASHGEIVIDLMCIESLKDTSEVISYQKMQNQTATQVTMKSGRVHMIGVPREILAKWWKGECHGFYSGTSRGAIKEPLGDDEDIK